ncbi:hypothetical protein ACQPZZ_09780 [Microbispora sp. CA-135349]|uniref:hypothetical protein n=1 Tax=Microbispora sp. CA-135349 TaxID=3239953 RepID=UPI003D91F3FE
MRVTRCGSSWAAAHLIRLTVARDGTAVGRFHQPCGFMLLRSQRDSGGQAEGEHRESGTDLDPRRVVRSGRDADTALGSMLPGVNRAYGEVDDGEFRMWLSSADSEAEVRYMPGDRQAVVHQRGPRDLWDEVEAAFLRWAGLGSPGRDRLGLAVTPEEQYVWLDLPERRLRTLADHGDVGAGGRPAFRARIARPRGPRAMDWFTPASAGQNGRNGEGRRTNAYAPGDRVTAGFHRAFSTD